MMMLRMLVALLLLLLAGSATVSAVGSFTPLSFSQNELVQEQSLPRLAAALTSTGLITIQLPHNDESVAATRATALKGLCQCQQQQNQDFTRLQGADQVLLGDGQTVRSTLATATVGFSPLPLKTQELSRQCGVETAQAMDTLRDQVAQASLTFLQAVDKLLLQAKRQELFTSTSYQQQRPLLTNSYGVTYKSVKSIVQGATNLEHFHVYSKISDESRSSNRQASLPVHTDAGLFLAFVPAQHCDSNSNEEEQDQSFLIKDPADGQLKTVQFQPNSIAIMLGTGAEQWLNTPHTLQLKATRHAVHMQAGQSRAWYGMMHLVPESAIVEHSATTGQPKTFGDMRQAMILKGKAKTSHTFADINDNNSNEVEHDISIGCGFSNARDTTSSASAQSNNDEATMSINTMRRRLQHVENAGACNNQTNFYCWMTCLDIPNVDNAQGYVSENYGLYCLDPAILASTGQVSQATEPCNEDGTIGLAMNSNCVGMWQPKAPNVPSQEVVIEETSTTALAATDFEEAFCYGGTSMYMDGFNWLGTTCAIYLFPSLVLDSAGDVVLACIFTIVFGMLLEFVIQQRRATVRKFGPGKTRLAVSAGFYAAQLTMGYAVMLVVMIYSIPLFISVVVGLVGGHVLFSAPDAIIKFGGTRTTSSKNNSKTERMQEDKSHHSMEGASHRLYMNRAASASGHTAMFHRQEEGQGSETFHSAQVYEGGEEADDNHSTAVDSSSCARQKKTCPSSGSDDEGSFDPEVPEGSTPCCQNQL